MESGNLRTIPSAGRRQRDARTASAGLAGGLRSAGRSRKRIGPPGVGARRPCTTAWCDQISTPAENQLRFTVPSTDTVLLRLFLVSTNRHDADRSPLQERRGNNAQQPTNDREQA